MYLDTSLIIGHDVMIGDNRAIRAPRPSLRTCTMPGFTRSMSRMSSAENTSGNSGPGAVVSKIVCVMLLSLLHFRLTVSELMCMLSLQEGQERCPSTTFRGYCDVKGTAITSVVQP